jgi:hypothetical protein
MWVAVYHRLRLCQGAGGRETDRAPALRARERGYAQPAITRAKRPRDYS